MDDFSVPSGSLPPIPPSMGNNNAVAPPVIQPTPPPVTPPQAPAPMPDQTSTPTPTPPPTSTPTAATTASSGSSVPVAKILLAVIPFFAFVVTGAISYTLMNQKQPVKYLSRASEPSPSASQVVEASKSGCVLSLQFSKNGKTNEELKNEALLELQKLKTRVEQGEKAQNIVYQILENRIKFKNTAEKDPYSKYNINQAINFCFANSTEMANGLGKNFYITNPNFHQKLIQLKANSVSEPFIAVNNLSESLWIILAL